MTSAGVGVAVHLDGFTAAGLAAHRALVAAGMTLGRRRGRVRRHPPRRGRIQRRAAAPCAGRSRARPYRLLGDRRAHRRRGARERDRRRGAGARRRAAAAGAAVHLGRARRIRAPPARASARGARDVLGGDVDGAAVAVLVDPAELDAADFVAGIADAAPELHHHRRRRVGRRTRLPRVLGGRGAHRRVRRAGVAARAASEPGHDPGLPGARRSADDHRRRRKPDPGDRRPPRGRGATSARCPTRATPACAR